MIPIRDALISKRILIPSSTCVMCDFSLETANHLVISCNFAHWICTAVFQWLKIPMPRYSLCVFELLGHIKNYNLHPRISKAVYLVIATICWTLWRVRNEAIFQGKRGLAPKVFSDIKAATFLWVTTRAGFRDLC
ncbi:hypothetical protein HanIR_Chr07g0337781 [Helianthus annuus]|nr:hypothetical protein HanIR_Chr07g0337781 [Helianthus annuus]